MEQMVPTKSRGVTPIRDTTLGTNRTIVTSVPRRVRGFTPNKNNFGQAQSSSSSASRVPKLNLTIEQELEILERMETGNYVVGAGWDQFLPKEQNTTATVKPKCQQNLLDAFSSLQHQPSSRSSSYNHISENTVLSAVPQEDNYVLPEYLKMIDKIIEEMDNYKDLMERAIDTVAEAQYHELFPMSSIAVIAKLETASNLLQNILKQRSSETTKLFFGSPPKQDSIPCHVDKQTDFVETVYKLSGLLEKFNNYLSMPKNDLNLEDQVQKLAEIVDKFGADVIAAENEIDSASELLELLEINDDESSFCSSEAVSTEL